MFHSFLFYFIYCSKVIYLILNIYLWVPADGREESAKEKIDTLDDENKVITYSLFDGEVSENYKSLKGTLEVMDEEYGALVRWSFEYEKIKEDITGAFPNSYLDLVLEVTKAVDAHLVKE